MESQQPAQSKPARTITMSVSVPSGKANTINEASLKTVVENAVKDQLNTQQKTEGGNNNNNQQNQQGGVRKSKKSKKSAKKSAKKSLRRRR